MLYYTERGEGEALILLHGNGEDGGYFEHQAPDFARHFRVLCVDTRGHGRSPRGDAPFTLTQFARDLLELMDGLGIARTHLLGFSDGANIAMLFALSHPERVDRLVLNAGNMDPGGVKRSVQLPIELAYGLVSLIARFDRRAVAKRELLGLMVNQPRLRPEDLRGLTMPTLVIAGDRDMIRPEHTEAIHRAIPQSRLVILPGSHFVAHENPEPFNRAVLEFLTARP